MHNLNKILITGAIGFVGINLTLYLQNAGYIALGISRNPKETQIIAMEQRIEIIYLGMAIASKQGLQKKIKK